MSVTAEALAQLATVSFTSAPPEIYTARFVTSLTAAITSGLRPTLISVADTAPVYGQGTFSIAIYDAGTDASPVNYEALEVIGGGASNSWTVVTEAGWSALAHANGSTVVATVLTPRSLQQPLNNHILPAAVPDPHSIYIKKQTFTGKGQLLVGTGNQQVFMPLPSGADGLSLVADSTQTGGLSWRSFSINSVLAHMGDLIVGGFQGLITRFGVGSVGQILTSAQNTPLYADPNSSPSCSAGGGSGSLSNGVQYDFAYAWRSGISPDGGTTPSSSITVFTATASGVVTVTCPSAPTTGATLVVYANIHGSPVMEQVTLPNASISTTNALDVSAILAGAGPPSINTSGGVSPAWTPITTILGTIPVVSQLQLQATGSLTATALAQVFGSSGPLHNQGLVPDPGPVFGATRFLREDTVWVAAAIPIITTMQATARLSASAVPQVFGPSGPAHGVGAVSDPGAVAGSTRFLREDATWVVPPGTGTTIANNLRIGATASMFVTCIEPNFGASGVGHGVGNVPDPGSSPGANRFLREDANWVIPGAQATTLANNQSLVATASMIAWSKEQIFGPSGPAHAIGDVPDPGVTPGAARFLREDGTWAVPPATASNTITSALVPIQTQTPSGVTNVTFSVPAGYRNLLLTINVASSTAATQTLLTLQFNGDGTGTYDNLLNQPSTTYNNLNEAFGATSMAIADVAGSTAPAGTPGGARIYIADCANTTFHKEVYGFGGVKLANTTTNLRINGISGYWRNTAAITSITLALAAGNFVAGSRITLWGESDSQAFPAIVVPTGGLVPIQTQVPSGIGTATFTVPSGYRNIRITGQTASDVAATSDSLSVQFNGDTGANYDTQLLSAAATTATASETLAQTSAFVSQVSGATAPANAATPVDIYIPNHVGSTFLKHGISRGSLKTADSTGGMTIDSWGFEWRSASTIASVTLLLTSGNFVSGTTFTLWGESDTPAAVIVNHVSLSANTSLTAIPFILMGASGPGHNAGYVPDPGAIAGITRFLREDATWQAPVGTSLNASLSSSVAMQAVPQLQVFGPSGTVHSLGLVPDPGSLAGSTRFLREDGTWAVPVGGGGGASGGGSIVPIQTQTLTSSQPNISFTVPPGFKNIRLTFAARGDSSTPNEVIQLQVNGDTGANYDYVHVDSSGIVSAPTNQTLIAISYLTNAGSVAGTSTNGQLFIEDYANTTFFKNVSALERIGASNRSDYSSGTWKNTAVVTTLVLSPSGSPNFVTGSTFTLWGESDVLTVTVQGLVAQATGTMSAVGFASSTNALTGDTTMTNPNQYYDGPSVVVGAGVWLLSGTVTLFDNAPAAFTAKLWDGTNVLSSSEANVTVANDNVSIALSALVVVQTSTIYKISAASTATGGLIKAAANDNGAGNNASTLLAIPVGVQ